MGTAKAKLTRDCRLLQVSKSNSRVIVGFGYCCGALAVADKVNVDIVDFATLSLRQQLTQASKSCMLYGPHG